MKVNYVAIQDLNLSNATVIGFDGCSVIVVGSDLVCKDCFGNVIVKFPFELATRYQHLRGLPEEIGIDEDGNFEAWEIDYDDEDYFGYEEQSIEILEGYSHITTINFTLVIKH